MRRWWRLINDVGDEEVTRVCGLQWGEDAGRGLVDVAAIGFSGGRVRLFRQGELAHTVCCAGAWLWRWDGLPARV